MDRSQYSHVRPEDNNGNFAKFILSRPLNTLQSREFGHYGQEDQSSRPNTPSMTRGSSSSTSSSIITCETCGNSSQHCGCQSHCDCESIRYQASEEYVLPPFKFSPIRRWCRQRGARIELLYCPFRCSTSTNHFPSWPRSPNTSPALLTGRGKEIYRPPSRHILESKNAPFSANATPRIASSLLSQTNGSFAT
jgi:hypothetical protein